jgi:hypothetical protein
MTEQMFHFTYGSPLIQALVGLEPDSAEAKPATRNPAREKVLSEKRKELEKQFEEGGTVEAALRAIAFVLRGQGAADERSFAVIKALHEAQLSGRPRTQGQLKKVLREQSLLLRLDEKRAVAALPKLLPKSAEERARVLRAIQRVVAAQGELKAEGKRRLARIEKLFGAKAAARTKKEAEDVRP